MNRFQIVLLMIAGALFFACEKTRPGDGKPTPAVHAESGKLPSWQKGCLDIHFINTGTGESSFIIMPDGTQMLVDMAGALTDPTEELYVPRRQDASVRPGEWINGYLSELKKWTGNNVIDYVSVTHMHGDHMGTYSDDLPMSESGPYRMTSVADVLEGNQVGLFVDRGWNDYDYPRNMYSGKQNRNYVDCIRWREENAGLNVEQFHVSSLRQFVMKHEPESYPDFRIMNVASNGTMWDGTDLKELFPDKSKFDGTGEAAENSPSENHVSTVFKLSYGRFDYYSGGDISYNGYSYFDWKNAELPVARAVGRVEVMKANHHGSFDANCQETLSALSPQVIVVNVWRNVQPRLETLQAMTSRSTNNGMADIFTTNMTPQQEKDFGADASRVLGKNGHVVIRVNPGGAEYYVYVLDDTSHSMTIQKRFGPYKSR